MSILELMIVIAIMGILTVAAMVSFSGNRPKKEVEVEARKFAAAIREAQNYALTGKKGTSPNIACGWGIKIFSQTNFSIFYNRLAGFADCAGFNSPTVLNPRLTYIAGQSFNSVSYTLNKVNISLAPSGAYFTIPFGPAIGANGSPVVGNAKFLLTSQTDSNVKYTVCLSSSGMVTEKSGDVVC